jgi:hypothetical protein
MKEGLKFPVAVVTGILSSQIVEIVLTELCVKEYMICKLSEELYPRTSQSNIKGIARRFAKHGCTGVTVVEPKPHLV